MRLLLAASKYLPEYTGAAHRLHGLYRSLREAPPNWSVQVVCGGIEETNRANYALGGLAIHRVRSRAPDAKTRADGILREWLDVQETWHYLKSVSCDVVHTIGTSAVVATAIHYARIKKIPFLVELVTPGAVADQGLPLLGRIWRPNMHRGGAIVAISEPIAEACRARGFNRNVWVRPNPVDTARFFPEPGQRLAYRRELTPFSAEDIVIASVAKFMPRKNQIFLIDMLAKLDGRFKLVLAGPYSSQGALLDRDRAYFEALQNKIAGLQLSERVHLVPAFVAADRYMKAADIFAMPVIEEGFGTPVLEAQACGLPVIANRDVPAFHDNIEDGVTGFLRPLDIEAWVQAAMAAADTDHASLDRRAREIAARYSFTATRESYRRLLEHLAQAGPDAAIDVGAVLGLAKPDGAPSISP